jgi:riboflavin synthase
MFTGIVEALGTITHISSKGTNLTFTIQSAISHELKVDQSLAHSGVCLTVESIGNDLHTVTAIDETLQKTNAGKWKVGDKVNLERCLQFNGRIDGHIVQGHVDATGTCIGKYAQDGSWLYTFSFDESFAALMIEKGSICLNGISLTVFNVTRNSFSVAVIPYTYEHTNIGQVNVKDEVNLEFDVLGKYMQRNIQLRNV